MNRISAPAKTVEKDVSIAFGRLDAAQDEEWT